MVLIMNFQTISTYAWFLYNQDYIAEVLCINKDKTAMHCDGKCILMERLAKQDQNKNHNPEFPGAEERSVFLFYNGYETGDLSPKDFLSLNNLPAYYSPFLTTGYDQGLFRPPKC